MLGASRERGGGWLVGWSARIFSRLRASLGLDCTVIALRAAQECAGPGKKECRRIHRTDSGETQATHQPGLIAHGRAEGFGWL